MYVVMDKNCIPRGPFADADEAHSWGKKKYPDQPYDERLPPFRYGWSVVAIRPTD